MIDLRLVPPSMFSPALECNLRRIATPAKACSHFLAALRIQFHADAAWLDSGVEGDGQNRIFDGDRSLFDESLVLRFAAGAYPELPNTVLLAPLRVHGKRRGVLGVARSTRDFELGRGRDLNRLAKVLGVELARREEERLDRVLARIKDKVVSDVRSRDLAYQILDSLNELVQYDHSAALLIHDEAAGVFRVEAEKIVWAKAKSTFIGHRIAATPELVDRLRAPDRLRLAGEDDLFAPLVDYARGDEIPATRSVLLASLFFEDEFLGVLKIASREPDAFSEHDLGVVERFVPAAAVAIRNAHVRISLEDKALRAETRAGLVTLARAVAHDVNNAIGAILPLAEQLREDAVLGALDPATAERDLALVVEKAALCKRIFSNMLQLSADRRSDSEIDVGRVLVEIGPMLESLVAPRRIRLVTELAAGLRPVAFSKQYLERIVWNLVTNSVEAIGSRTGTIAIRTGEADGGGVWLEVQDDGPGIDAAILQKVEEPFFTTKSGGTGLGLSICRSMAAQYGGSLAIESRPGEGTRVRLRFPASSRKPS